MQGNVVARSIKLTGQIDNSEMNASDIRASTVNASTIRGSKLIGNEIEGGIITGTLFRTGLSTVNQTTFLRAAALYWTGVMYLNVP
ncbi:hypothetical protein QOZ95_001157 [Paenibacillus brasilensis]|uniref:Uncharacterized protein n=1 Tax=Paenibacillus brasilensis TaxID=128574 RepID=A0ABU0KX92_9BACL|nr:hypothetical protein [Paenibacillus brasilensis]